MAIKKGQSGNPGGRSAATLADGRTVAEVAREHTREAIETLVGVMTEGETSSARVSAANAILDRGRGRPKQDISLETNVDLAEAIGKARARLLAHREEEHRLKNEQAALA